MQNDTTSQRTPTSRDRAIERGVAHALEQSRAGNVPILLRKIERAFETQEYWTVGSRTSGGTVYNVDVTANAHGIETRCSCAAADADRLCWHRCIVRLAIYGDVPHEDGHRAVDHLAALELTSADLFGQAAD